jgi:hypothetical protein
MGRPRKPSRDAVLDRSSTDGGRKVAPGSLRTEVETELPPDAVPETPARRRRARGEEPAAAALVPPAPHWAELGPMTKALLHPLYEALEAETPADDVFSGFCSAWGRVVDFYLPSWSNRPEAPAAAATFALAAPLLIAWQRKRTQAPPAPGERVGGIAPPPPVRLVEDETTRKRPGDEGYFQKT